MIRTVETPTKFNAVMIMPVKRRKKVETLSTNQLLTYEDYLRLPETMKRYEIVNEVIVVAPAPASEHQRFLFQLAKLLNNFVLRRRLGVVLPAPVDVLIGKRQKSPTHQLDILFLSAERTDIRSRQTLNTMPTLKIAPI